MKRAANFYEKRSFWMTGGAGFIFAAVLSLAGGNLVLTSSERGLAGMLAAMILYWLFTKFYQSIKQVLDHSSADNSHSNPAGTNFDVSLPAESPLDAPQPSDFQPWVIGEPAAITDEQAKKMAETMREMQN